MGAALLVLLAGLLAAAGAASGGCGAGRLDGTEPPPSPTGPPRHLSLAGCALDDLALAGDLSALQTLDLSRNQLTSIGAGQFQALTTLQLLNLTGNTLRTVSVDGFRGLRALRTLDLADNQLDALADGLFTPLLSVQHLNVSGNRLRALSEHCFGNLPRLQQLDVSGNRLARVAPGTLQSLPSLSRLLLADNPALGGAHPPAADDTGLLVGTGRRLHTVDASRTGLHHVPGALTRSVRTLRLAGNRIATVRCGDLDSYPLLQLLDVASNALADVEEDALGRLDALAVLYLTGNRLRAIPRSLPAGLRVLHLEANAVQQIVSGDLLGLGRLEVLLLNDNAIAVVQEGAFSQLSALATLDLSRNPLTILPAGALAGPLRLQALRLSGLAADPPPGDASFPLPAPEHLTRLDLSHSPGLARQLLADNAALAAARDLQQLDLTAAAVTRIRSDLLHYLPQLRDLYLAGNRVDCSELLWLALWLRRQDQPQNREVTCAAPPELYGTPLVDLQDADVLPATITSAESVARTITALETLAPEAATETYPTTRLGRRSELVTELFDITTEQQTDTTPSTTSIASTTSTTSTTSNASTASIMSTTPATTPSTYSLSTSTESPVDSTPEPENATEHATEHVTEHATEHATENVAENVTEQIPVSSRRHSDFPLSVVKAHPGALTLAAAAAAATVATLLSAVVSRVRRRRQRAHLAGRYSRHRDMEVTSVAGVHELW